ncbi:MAG: SDR family NAD(P)-dependent oxidoreductase [Nevskiaceae bacterium]|nr:MAG: SDR family NAD(P)-dependent oxidoreductase [Nevskiaceae bacterium]TAM25212.1 MAG: SDR family NAD(P)-dependent oxidoreductase [Nevskiaceae bacterium]
MSASPSTVMITGAAGSLGQAVAAAFAAEGARLVLVDVSTQALAARYPGESPQRLCLAVDLLDEAAVQAAVAQAQQRFGGIDALCNIAGGFDMGTPVHATPAPAWQKMQDLNVGTLLNTVRAVVPLMQAQGGGRIVNVAAGGGLKGQALMGAYSAAKSTVIRITEAMAAELREQGINVNAVLPSIIDTPPNRAAMPKADPGKWVAPGDLAAVIRFLCSDAARAIHGAALPVVGLS